MDAPLVDFKRKGYRLRRSASRGASITLLSGCGSFSAMFECADKCAQVLGDRELEDLGDGLLESIPFYKIPSEYLYEALQKLSQRFSVSLIEYTQTKTGGRFVCLWRVNASPTPAFSSTTSTNLDDY